MSKSIKPLKMRCLPRQALNAHTCEMIDMLACSSDPYSGMLYEVAFDACRQQAKNIGAALGKHITLTPVIIKLIGQAIAENPVFNRLLLGGTVYEFDEIHIANLVSVPNADAITYVVLENPHQKTLADIQQELFAGLASAKERFSSAPGRLESFITHLIYRYGLYRLIGQKRTFSIGYTRGLVSNISLSVHSYATPSNFIMVKDVISPLPFYPKIHVSGPVTRPVLDEGMLVSKELLYIHVTSDHRIVNGAHAHEFGRTMARIAEHPEQYLQ